MRHATKPLLVSGFTLIEMLVTVAIFAVISSVILVSGSTFDSNILLTNFAYDVALSTRQAQVYGLNVRSTSGTNFSPGYGITFRGTTPTQYEFFTDLNGDKANSGGSELITTYQLNSGYTVSNICGVSADGITRSCTATGDIGGITVTYTRPNPDAVIRSLTGTNYSSAEITLSGPRGNTRKVVINTTGQISVQQ